MGLLAAALFATPGYDADSYGAFYGMAEPLGAAAVGALAIIGWSVLWGLLTFGALRMIGMLRVSTVDEVAGMDTLHHGGSAYGVDATEAPPPEYPPQYTAPPRAAQELPPAAVEMQDANGGVVVDVDVPPPGDDG